jgi:hypothetical protein
MVADMLFMATTSHPIAAEKIATAMSKQLVDSR